jgi:hypothetical protein
MKKFITSFLWCIALIALVPMSIHTKQVKVHQYYEDQLHELASFVKQLSMLDEETASILHEVSRSMNEGNVVTKEDIIDALEYAQSMLIEYNDHLSDEQVERMSDLFNQLIDAIDKQDNRSCSSMCDDDDALQVRRILCVLNKAIFCDIAIFRDRAIFLKRVEMQNGLEVDGRLRVRGKAKIDNLDAKRADIDRLTADRGTIDDLSVDDLTAVNATIDNFSVTGTIVAACDLVVGCDLFMNNSTSPAIGNILKGGESFIQNFGVNNTFVGINAGNFVMTGTANVGFGTNALHNDVAGSDNVAVGFDAMLNANDSELVAIGSGALQNYHQSAFGFGTGQNVAVGFNALNANVSGNSNTAVGWSALASDVTTVVGNNTALGWSALGANTTGTNNTGLGNATLLVNTAGSSNTAVGSFALTANTTGNFNEAVGYASLANITDGTQNVAMGAFTMLGTSGSFNVAIGHAALAANTVDNNVAVGFETMVANTTGIQNTAVGNSAMLANTTGSFNIALGSGAGDSLTTGSNNIDIGNIGVAAESNTIRIGTVGTQTANFQAGIFGAGPITGAAVLVDATTGQLGTTASSIRYKENVRDMNDASSAILKLRPVTFSYKADASHAQQYGLIAEEVHKIMPALVVKDAQGSIETVKYHELTTLLLNELIKQHQMIVEQNVTIEHQNNEIHAIRDRLMQLEAHA